MADIPNELHDLSLPEFRTPGPPPGQPLLSEHDTQTFDSFLSGFDTSVDQNKDGMMQQFQHSMDLGHDWNMPPMFVASGTSLQPRNGAEWQSFPMTDFGFGSDTNMATINQSVEFQHGIPGHGFPNNSHYDHNLLNQLHTAAQTVQPSFPVGWPQNFQHDPTSHVQQAPRPAMRFGTDVRFQPSGYAAPDGQIDHSVTPSLDWLEAQSSAANTQPNTEPNTQPSSPIWTKKRKLDDYQADNRRNGFKSSSNGNSGRTQPTPTSATSRSRSFIGHDQLPTPISRSQTNLHLDHEEAVDDEDADYDEDGDGTEFRTRSDSPSSSSKAKVSKSASKSTRARKKSTASNTPSKAKSKASRNSIGGAQTARVPLTADQKKMNHTNSEQRRRDATARAYAELYDLVPELEEIGKQSTMKKLEIVVKKVQQVKDRVQRLRAALGLDIETGAPLHQHNVSNRSIGGGLLQPDMASWPQ